MAQTGLRGEERIGLGLALVAHAGLVALLVWQPPGDKVLPPPERIQVTLGEEVGLTSTSPEPAAAPAPDEAPELGEPAPPAPAQVATPEPQPVPTPQPRVMPEPPRPVPVARPVPRPLASPKPVVKPSPKPSPSPRATSRPSATASPLPGTTRVANAPPLPGTSRTATQPATRPGGTRVGNDFLQGVQGAKPTGTARSVPAAAIGADVRSSINSAIARELKPHWSVPQGPETELLVTRVRFRLLPDGTLSGEPEVLGTTGMNPTNQAQVKRHQEQAVRAVRLAAPFNLPEEYYNGWRVVTSTFDRRLAQ